MIEIGFFCICHPIPTPGRNPFFFFQRQNIIPNPLSGQYKLPILLTSTGFKVFVVSTNLPLSLIEGRGYSSGMSHVRTPLSQNAHHCHLWLIIDPKLKTYISILAILNTG